MSPSSEHVKKNQKHHFQWSLSQDQDFKIRNKFMKVREKSGFIQKPGSGCQPFFSP